MADSMLDARDEKTRHDEGRRGSQRQFNMHEGTERNGRGSSELFSSAGTLGMLGG